MRFSTWDGVNLWAYHNNRQSFLKIDPGTGTVLSNISISYPITGIMWHNDRLWAAGWTTNEIIVFDTTGRPREVFDSPNSGSGDYGITYNGSHLLVSNWLNKKIYFLDIPIAAGELWNIYDAPDTHTLDLDWNGTHYFVCDADSNRVYILHDGTFEIVSYIDLPFTPLGIAVINNVLFISDDDAPWSLLKYSTDGTQLGNFTSIRLEIDSLAY
ncbi:MAG: YncE family protein, partial [Candidatus Helarchaeota archaeon]